MNELLIEAFQQKDWATRALIVACADRSADELTRPASGFGSTLATLNHLMLADAGYVASLGGGRAVWAVDGNEPMTRGSLRRVPRRVALGGSAFCVSRSTASGSRFWMVVPTRPTPRSL